MQTALLIIFLLSTLALSLCAGIHAVMTKRDPRAGLGWFAFCLLAPWLGPFVYALAGTNRIRRTAARLRRTKKVGSALTPELRAFSRASINERFGDRADELVHAIGNVTRGRNLLDGNTVDVLRDGDEAYPQMLAAIETAQSSISLMTYIFDNDTVGQQFVDALDSARQRGVEIRVLVDAVGARYSFPTILGKLRAKQINARTFLPLHKSALFHFNLRNHRRLLAVDGKTAFTGGLNIRAHHVLSNKPKNPTRDLHFRLRGPVVTQLQEAFAADWRLSTGEHLSGAPWFAATAPSGATPARAIADGPDEDLYVLPWTLMAAVNAAKQRVRIVTPYFLPDFGLISALRLAVLRGVEVEIVLPEKGNLPIVQWAMQAHLPRTLDEGCRAWLTPAPFDHTKLMLIDDYWALFGSTNWDPRSLRLNFELNVETYDVELAHVLHQEVDARIASAKEITAQDLISRPLAVQFRDAVARLAMPYL